jgi:hypothetical protein
LGHPVTGGCKYKKPDPPSWEFDRSLTILFCKSVIVAKSKEVKAVSNMAEFSKEGYGLKDALLPVMIIKYCESGGIASYISNLGSKWW